MIKTDHKVYLSSDYNFAFDKKTGLFLRWGKNAADDPDFSPSGPEIADIEVSTICSNGCSFCYKSNTKKGKNMSLEVFKQVFEKLPKQTLTQIAFGIGDIDANPDLWKIMEHCRENDVIPNITINGKRMTLEAYIKLASLCGAVAVSLYDFETCYETVDLLSREGLKQVNIHSLLSLETMAQCFKVMHDSRKDKRLVDKLNAIIFLWLKPKGERNCFHEIGWRKYQHVVDFSLDRHIKIGFDSCSAPMFLRAVETRSDYEQLKVMCEPCESTLFSIYINVDGKAFPCSFSEGESYQGADVLAASDFQENVWNGPEFSQFRNKVLNNKNSQGCRICQIYRLGER